MQEANGCKTLGDGGVEDGSCGGVKVPDGELRVCDGRLRRASNPPTWHRS